MTDDVHARIADAVNAADVAVTLCADGLFCDYAPEDICGFADALGWEGEGSRRSETSSTATRMAITSRCRVVAALVCSSRCSSRSTSRWLSKNRWRSSSRRPKDSSTR